MRWEYVTIKDVLGLESLFDYFISCVYFSNGLVTMLISRNNIGLYKAKFCSLVERRLTVLRRNN